MATHGTMTAFDPSKEDWTCYTKHYFIANEVADTGKKHSILLSACGATTFKIIRNLVGDDKLDSTSYDDPKPSVIVQRYKFNTRSRAEGESVATYVAALRDIAQHCEYKDPLQDMLRDRLVCGLKHRGMTNRLLAEKDLMYDKALELAQAMESAERGTRHNQSTQNPQEVHHNTVKQLGRNQKKPTALQGARGQLSCYRCLGEHLATSCKFKEAVCHACKKRGHIVKACRSKGIQRRQVKRNNYVEENDASQEDDAYTLFTLRNQGSAPIFKEVFFNGVYVEMELDIGAAVTVITQETYQKIAQQSHMAPLQSSDLRLKSYSGESIVVYGQVPVVVKYAPLEHELCVHMDNIAGERDWQR